MWSCGGARDNPSHLRQISATVVPTEQKKRKKTGKFSERLADRQMAFAGAEPVLFRFQRS